MRNLDVEWVEENPPTPAEERTFVFAGETLIRLEEVPLAAFRTVERDDGTRMVEPLVTALKLSIEPRSHEAFDRVTARGDIGIKRLLQLWRMVVAEGSGRPTPPPADSSDGRSTNGTGSTDGPSTDEAWTSGALVPGASPTSPTPSSSTPG